MHMSTFNIICIIVLGIDSAVVELKGPILYIIFQIGHFGHWALNAIADKMIVEQAFICTNAPACLTVGPCRITGPMRLNQKAINTGNSSMQDIMQVVLKMVAGIVVK